MTLTVKQLIAKLRKQDPDALVVWQANDQDDSECDGYVRAVVEGSELLLKAEGVEKLVALRP